MLGELTPEGTVPCRIAGKSRQRKAQKDFKQCGVGLSVFLIQRCQQDEQLSLTNCLV